MDQNGSWEHQTTHQSHVVEVRTEAGDQDALKEKKNIYIHNIHIHKFNFS